MHGRLGDFFVGDVLVEIFDTFEEVGDVEESVAIETDIHKGRLHAGQHARHTPLVDASD